MDPKEHKLYLEEFKSYSKEIIATKKTTKDFLVRTGINTPTGRLTKVYSHKTSADSNKK